jgi:chorismate dehydratase
VNEMDRRETDDAPSSSGQAPTAQPLRVARLPYLNVLPYFLGEEPRTVLSASPRKLCEEALAGRVDAGPFSLLDAWRLEALFEPLAGDFGIAVKGPARSVLLFSRVPLEDLDQARIGVTEETSTSVRLLEALLVLREGVKPVLMRGFTPQDTARLLIGDQALLEAANLRKDFPHVYDLGREWYLWRERPFVFAKWLVRRTAPAYLKDELRDRLDASLQRFERNRDTAVWKASAEYRLSAAQVRDYLSGFVYRLGHSEREAEDLFRTMLPRLPGKGG